MSQIQQNVQMVADSMGVRIFNTNSLVKETAQQSELTIKSRTLWGCVGLLMALLAAVLSFLVLRKRITSSDSAIGKIKDTQKVSRRNL